MSTSVNAPLELYPLHLGRYDESRDVTGRMRAGWRDLLTRLQNMAPKALNQRLAWIDHSLQENGVIFRPHGETESHPWLLDPLPLILSSKEWGVLAQAVAQRARLFDAILADLYGPQRLLTQGLLPPALIFGQHGFLWPCFGLRPVAGVFLHRYAVDLVRSPDGRWWAIADHTQSPVGLGYALENRLLVSRVFSEAFRELQVQRLAGFFREMQQSMATWAPVEPGEQPFAVMLTNGPSDPTYFEQAYLARYLGYPLVEGQDLTVRAETVFLKTLNGLKRVHTIARRVPDENCDPLELRSESLSGIPGLLTALRAQRVMVANVPGSGVLESTALMGFLPAIATSLLGEPLKLPSVATWWCGEAPALDYVCKHLDSLVLKPAYPGQDFPTTFGPALGETERARLLERIAAQPHAYVAQELITPSLAPVFDRRNKGRLEPWQVGLRLFAIATPQGYRVMPGGLTRVGPIERLPLIPMRRGGATKDTWVLTEGMVESLTLIKNRLGPVDLVRSGKNLSSRVVENLFWFGRYCERMDVAARLLRLMLLRVVDVDEVHDHEIESLARIGVELEILAPTQADRPLLQRMLDTLFGLEEENGVLRSIQNVLRTAGQMRERFSADHWHSLNRLQRSLQVRRDDLSDVLEGLDRVVMLSASIAGYSFDNMTRDPGWHFLVIGRRLERLTHLCRTLARILDDPDSGRLGGLDWLLELTDSLITYRSRYSRQAEWLPLLDLILFDATNPHAMAFQVRSIGRYLSVLDAEVPLGPEVGETALPNLERIAARILAFDPMRLIALDRESAVALRTELEALLQAAYALSDALSRKFFSHIEAHGHQTLGI